MYVLHLFITSIYYMYYIYLLHVLHLFITCMHYIYLLHLFISSTLQCPQGPVGRFFCGNTFLNITFWHQIQNLRKNSFRSAPIAPPEVLCASSYGSSKVKLECWSQCKVLLLVSILYFLSFGVLIKLQSEIKTISFNN